MAEKSKPKSPFAIALAARKGDIPPEALKGAARRLFDDKTLTQAVLQQYAKARPSERTLSVGRPRRSFKRA